MILSKIFRLATYALVVFSSIQCSEFSSNQAAHSSVVVPEPDPVVPLSSKVYQPGLVRQSQILPAFTKCLGLKMDEVSQGTRDIYFSLKGNLSEDGNIKGLSAPLLMAVTQLAGDVCGDLIKKEMTAEAPHFFTGFDLSSPDNQGETPLTESIDKITRSCWGRGASDLEKNVIIESYKQSLLANNRGTRGALLLCTSLMSSPDVVFY